MLSRTIYFLINELNKVKPLKILAIEKELEKKPDDEYKNLLMKEARCAWELYQSGVFREIHFMQDRHIAVIILEVNDAEAAKKALASLPLVEAGYIDFEVMPLVPYPGFARLFKD